MAPQVFAKAEVTIGGIATDGLSQKDFAAKHVPGLHVIGEAVEVTGWLGVYNLPWAWASGWAAAQGFVALPGAPNADEMNPPTALLTSFLSWFDLFGIAVFAASGALAAARARLTFISFGFFALVTGVGGGTVRDLLIGVPVFWVQDWRVPATCMASAILVWLTPARWWRGRALDWFDAVGLAVYATFGAAKAFAAGVPALPAMMMGVITACVGGIIRDLLAGQPSILLKPEIYVTAAALSAASFVGLAAAGMDRDVAFVIAAAGGFAVRALAISCGLSIPSYQR